MVRNPNNMTRNNTDQRLVSRVIACCRLISSCFVMRTLSFCVKGHAQANRRLSLSACWPQLWDYEVERNRGAAKELKWESGAVCPRRFALS